MATTTGTHVNFVKVPTMAKFNDISSKVDGTVYFIVDEKKIHLDGVMYGFNDSDVANQFLELTGGMMSGDINMGGSNSIYAVSQITIGEYTNENIITAHPSGGFTFIAGTSGGQPPVLMLKSDNSIEFSSDSITGIPNPVHPSSPISSEYLDTHVIDKINLPNGIAGLDESGKVPSTQLPSYVDDVLEYSAKASFPATGETGKLYIDLSNNNVWRWSGSAYVNVSDGNAHLTLGTTQSTAYRGDRGKTAYDHSQEEGTNPHYVTASDVGLGSVSNYGLATETEAKAGSVNNKYMTPSRTKQAIETLAPRLSWEVVA